VQQQVLQVCSQRLLQALVLVPVPVLVLVLVLVAFAPEPLSKPKGQCMPLSKRSI
jgi:hypothetical protein